VKAITSSLSPKIPTGFAIDKLANFNEGRGLENESQWSLGAFVLPNDIIPEQTRLETFLVPGTLRESLQTHVHRGGASTDTTLAVIVEAVESSAGLTLLPDSLKLLSRPLCSTVSCALVIRKFDDANKNSKKKNNK
jgi:endonuclease G